MMRSTFLLISTITFSAACTDGRNTAGTSALKPEGARVQSSIFAVEEAADTGKSCYFKTSVEKNGVRQVEAFTGNPIASENILKKLSDQEQAARRLIPFATAESAALTALYLAPTAVYVALVAPTLGDGLQIADAPILIIPAAVRDSVTGFLGLIAEATFRRYEDPEDYRRAAKANRKARESVGKISEEKETTVNEEVYASIENVLESLSEQDPPADGTPCAALAKSLSQPK